MKKCWRLWTWRKAAGHCVECEEFGRCSSAVWKGQEGHGSVTELQTVELTLVALTMQTQPGVRTRDSGQLDRRRGVHQPRGRTNIFPFLLLVRHDTTLISICSPPKWQETHGETGSGWGRREEGGGGAECQRNWFDRSQIPYWFDSSELQYVSTNVFFCQHSVSDWPGKKSSEKSETAGFLFFFFFFISPRTHVQNINFWFHLVPALRCTFNQMPQGVHLFGLIYICSTWGQRRTVSQPLLIGQLTFLCFSKTCKTSHACVNCDSSSL